jgi:hypothetical protein
MQPGNQVGFLSNPVFLTAGAAMDTEKCSPVSLYTRHFRVVAGKFTQIARLADKYGNILQEVGFITGKDIVTRHGIKSRPYLVNIVFIFSAGFSIKAGCAFACHEKPPVIESLISQLYHWSE